MRSDKSCQEADFQVWQESVSAQDGSAEGRTVCIVTAAALPVWVGDGATGHAGLLTFKLQEIRTSALY